MRVSYNKLWKLLIDKNMKKGELRDAIGASKSTFAKLGKNQNVTLPVLLSICEYLKCDFGDISYWYNYSTEARVFCFGKMQRKRFICQEKD